LATRDLAAGRRIPIVVAGVAMVAGWLAWAAPARGATIPAFVLPNWDGRVVSSDALRGSTAILVFTYAKCVVGCPTVTFQLKGLDEELGHPPDLRFVLLSVNPTADTPAGVLGHFRTCAIDPERDPRWLFLGGTEAQVAPVLAAYGIQVKRTPTPLGELVEHTLKVVVVDPAGRPVATFATYQWDPEEMRHALGR